MAGEAERLQRLLDGGAAGEASDDLIELVDLASRLPDLSMQRPRPEFRAQLRERLRIAAQS